MKNILNCIARKSFLSTQGLRRHSNNLNKIVAGTSFLVFGGACSIRQSVVKEIFRRNPKKLHVIDINENKNNGYKMANNITVYSLKAG